MPNLVNLSEYKNKVKSAKPYPLLHVHTHQDAFYSIIQADLVDYTAKNGFTTIAFTNRGSLAGALRFCRLAQTWNLKPLIGMETYLIHGTSKVPAVLLIENNSGYEHLCQMIQNAADSQGFMHSVDFSSLKDNASGLIPVLLPVVQDGPDWQSSVFFENIKNCITELKNIFADIYIEVQPGSSGVQLKAAAFAKAMATEYGLKPVFQPEVRFLRRDAIEAFAASMAVRFGCKIDKIACESILEDKNYILPVEKYHDLKAQILPEDYSAELAERCCFHPLQFLKERFICQASTGEKDWLRDKVKAGLQNKFADDPDLNITEYEGRMNQELKLIDDLGLTKAFLLIDDIFVYAREQKIFIGIRLDLTGSLVAHLLRISEIDPVAYGLYCERGGLYPGAPMPHDFIFDVATEKEKDIIAGFLRDRFGGNVTQMKHYTSILDLEKSMAILGDVFGMDNLTIKLLRQEMSENVHLKNGWYTREYVLRNSTLYNRLLNGGTASEKAFCKALQVFVGLVCEQSIYESSFTMIDDTKYLPCFKTPSGTRTCQFIYGEFDDISPYNLFFFARPGIALLQEACRQISNDTGLDIQPGNLSLNGTGPDALALFQQSDTDGIPHFDDHRIKEILSRLHPDNLHDLLLALGSFHSEREELFESILRHKFRHPQQLPDQRLLKYLKYSYGTMTFDEDFINIFGEITALSHSASNTCRRDLAKNHMENTRNIFLPNATIKGFLNPEELFESLNNVAQHGPAKSHMWQMLIVAWKCALLKSRYRNTYMNLAQKYLTVLGDFQFTDFDTLSMR